MTVDAAVVVVAWPGCAWQEVAPALAMLPGGTVVGTHREVRVAEGYTLLADPLPSEAPGFLLLPGGNLDAAWHDEPLLRWLRDRRATRTAAVCNGVLLLGRAGRLDGRRVTHTAHAPYAARPEWAALLDASEPVMASSTYVDHDLVVDGHLVTAKPWAALRLAKLLATAFVGRDEAARLARYYAGCRDTPGEDPHQRWVVELRPVPGRATTRDDVRAHVAFLRGLESTGRLTMAGPFADDTGGMLVVRAASEAEARALVDADPFVQRGARVATLRAWHLSCDDNDHMGGGE